MPTNRFTINVPNPTGTKASVALRLQRLTTAQLAALNLDLPEPELKVTSAIISQDPCASDGQNHLNLKVDPYSSTEVQVIITTVPAGTKAGGSVAFHLIDHRKGKQDGGVTVTCVDRPGPEPPGQVIGTTRPCPVLLVGGAYPVAVGTDPRIRPTNSSIALGNTVELVAAVTNQTGSKLQGVQVYLEHLGSCDAKFEPITWNVGELVPKDVFYAKWPVQASGWLTGGFTGSVVVVSQRTNPVRLAATVTIGRSIAKNRSGSSRKGTKK